MQIVVTIRVSESRFASVSRALVKEGIPFAVEFIGARTGPSPAAERIIALGTNFEKRRFKPGSQTEMVLEHLMAEEAKFGAGTITRAHLMSVLEKDKRITFATKNSGISNLLASKVLEAREARQLISN